MARLSGARSVRRRTGRSRTRRFRPSSLWSDARLQRRWQRAYRRASVAVKMIVGVALALMLALLINWIYQVICKPSELLFPVSGTLYKTPPETWRQYGPIFRKFATRVITPDLLAAIAQIEGSGNPVARTYWRWSWTYHPLQIYRPASSAVGMYQITDSTFAEARHYCIRHHKVVMEGVWNDWHACWFNGLYSRLIPAHAAELTSAYLDRSVSAILARHHMSGATAQREQELAAMIHLCGAGAADEYVRRGFRFTHDQHCGDQEAHEYVAKVTNMKVTFDRLAVLQNDQH